MDHERAVPGVICSIELLYSEGAADSSAVTARILTAFVYYYNRQRPNQALDDRTLAEEVMER